LSAGNEKKGTYSATWVVHNTENMKWYETEVVLTNVRGGETAVNVKWQDPTQSHPAEQVTPGDFPDGNFSYNGTVTLNAFEGAQEVLLSIQDIDGHNIANLTRYSDGIQLMSAGRILLSSYAVGVGGTNNKFYSTTSTDGDIAIYGYSTATTGDSRGVMGRTDSTTGAAVYGLTSAASGKNYAVYGKVQSSPAGVAGYFEGGLGVRIHSAAYANSSVGNLFGCLSPYNCDNICYNHGLSCYRSLADDISDTARSGWSNSCNQVCNVMGSTNGIYACWCS
ncbi:MAG: hypothetical protein NTW67_05055, partial [Candidatus Woesearchaeota archaeon]|nr:hypothetical protein [Candidatus Woesearchaeota archaeon]